VFLDLNPEQRAAANSINGNFVILAGPGVGKTAMSIQRYLEMISTHGISPKDIANFTFTNSAAAEAVSRIGMFDADKVFRTFHSYALDLLQRERAYLPFSLCDTIIPVRGEKFQLLKDLMKMYPPITTFRSLSDRIEAWQCANTSPDQAIDEAYHAKGTEYFYASAFRDYEKKSREQGWLDFHGLITESVNLLETNPEVRERNKKKYIGLDEAQDTDIQQFRLLQLIYDGNIFAVGDESQLIYEWRSAQSGNLSNFAKTFPGSKTLYMGANYRSTQRLVSFFKKITPVDNGLASHMVSMREEGVDPTFTKFDDDIQEASVVLKCITDLENSAVIARTNRQLLNFQKMCMGRGIKSMILGKKDLWQQNEIRDLLDSAKDHTADSRPAHVVLEELMTAGNLIHRYRNTGSPLEKDPVENLNNVIKMSAKRGNIKEFLDWVRKLTYGIEAAKNKPLAERRDKTPILRLSTVHQMKGRQAKYVFVIGVNQKMMPHQDGEISEEKRIFFVACTRAADELHISFSGNRSEFLNDFINRIEEYKSE
jgi:DNA helicase-2/ATP-dependent DNA helicase PcrA